ncbi:MAG: DUF1223 domain-containing protein [Alphaproteobacteria bacterium]
MRLARLLLAVLASLAAVPAHAGERAPVLLELYTSQGCAPCRIADAYMAELVKRQDVIPLSLHIDYWDSPLWRDEFALPEATQRQRSYKKLFGMNYVYTPQVVVEGRAHVSGRLRDRIEGLIAEARRREAVPIELSRAANGTITVTLPGEAAAATPLPDRGSSGPARERAALLLMLYDRPHTVDIRGGQNAGQRITYYNVVREMRRIGSWNGAAQSLTLQITDAAFHQRAGMVVILQDTDSGAVLGAAALPFDGANNT